MKVDFNKLKAEISLPDFLLHLGWKFAPGSSNSSPKMTNGTQTIVIKKNHNGQYTYWDVHNDSFRGASVIDLMRQHMFEQTGTMPSLREVGETLQSYLNTNKIVTAQTSKINVSCAQLDDNQRAYLNNLLKPYNGNFLGKRGIAPETLSSPAFSNVFFSYELRKEGRIYNNTCIRLINEKGFQGISMRGIRDKDQKSFKGILGGKFDSIAVSRHDNTRPIDHIYIGESMIDNVSHYQMKLAGTDKNILYISTEGNITQGQMQLIKLLLSKQRIENIQEQVHYIFDNDENGYKYALKLDAYLKGTKLENIENMSPEELKEKVLQLPNVDLSVESDWNDDLRASLQKNMKLTFPKL